MGWFLVVDNKFLFQDNVLMSVVILYQENIVDLDSSSSGDDPLPNHYVLLGLDTYFTSFNLHQGQSLQVSNSSVFLLICYLEYEKY